MSPSILPPLQPRVPEHVVDAAVPILEARHDEQRVRQAVEIGDDERADLLLASEADRETLGAPTDGACHMKARRALGAAGQDEVLKRSEHLVHPVDRRLERLNVTLLDPRDGALRLVALQRAEVRTEMEELVLDPRQLGGEPRLEAA